MGVAAAKLAGKFRVFIAICHNMDEWDNPHRTRAPPELLHEYFAGLNSMTLLVCEEIMSIRTDAGDAWDYMGACCFCNFVR